MSRDPQRPQEDSGFWINLDLSINIWTCQLSVIYNLVIADNKLAVKY